MACVITAHKNWIHNARHFYATQVQVCISQSERGGGRISLFVKRLLILSYFCLLSYLLVMGVSCVNVWIVTKCGDFSF